jgi:hypothetical protein
VSGVLLDELQSLLSLGRGVSGFPEAHVACEFRGVARGHQGNQPGALGFWPITHAQDHAEVVSYEKEMPEDLVIPYLPWRETSEKHERGHDSAREPRLVSLYELTSGPQSRSQEK